MHWRDQQEWQQSTSRKMKRGKMTKDMSSRKWAEKEYDSRMGRREIAAAAAAEEEQ